MRTLIFTDSDVFAGTEQHMLELALGLRREGVEVLVACPVPGVLATKAANAKLEVVSIAKKGALDWRAVLDLRLACRTRSIDIIHSHNGRTAFLAAVASLFIRKIRLVATQHFLAPSYLSRSGIKAVASRSLHRWVDHRTDHLIAISKSAAQGAISRGEATENKITVIPNGITPPDRAALAPVPALRTELGIQLDVPLVVCVARLEVEKDVATLIDAMELVVKNLPNAACAIAGDGDLRQKLQQQIDQKGLQQSVQLLGFRSDVPSLMNAGDLFVLPSRAEPFGLVLLEAMSLAKPVVATAAGGPLEIVDQGRTGLLVPPGKPPEMAAAIVRILASPEIQREMGRRGQEKFIKEFTVERMVRATASVYTQATAKAVISSVIAPAGPREAIVE